MADVKKLVIERDKWEKAADRLVDAVGVALGVDTGIVHEFAFERAATSARESMVRLLADCGVEVEFR